MGLFKVINNKNRRIFMVLIPRNEFFVKNTDPLNFQSSETVPPVMGDSDTCDTNETNETGEDAEPHQSRGKAATREEVTAALDNLYKADKKVHVKLLRYAQRKIFQLTGKIENINIEAEFIVEEAIYRILKRKRKWYQSRVDNIFHLILMVIFSLIRIELSKQQAETNPLYNENEPGALKIKKKKSSKQLKYISYNDKKDDNDKDTAEAAIAKAYLNNNSNEEDTGIEDLINEIELLLENDEEAFFVFQARLDGQKSNIEIAKTLGIEVRNVENALKRIKRHLLNHNKNTN